MSGTTSQNSSISTWADPKTAEKHAESSEEARMFTAYMFERGALTPGQKSEAVEAFGVMPFGSGEKGLALYPYTPVSTRPAPGMGVWQAPVTGTRLLRGLGAPERIPAEAWREGGRSWVDLYPRGGRKMRVTHQVFGLGVAPAIALPTIAAGGAIGGLIALIQNAMDDDWSDREVFTSHARDIHSAMLAIQCILGGAHTGAPLVDTLGHEICPGGTKPVCKIPDATLKEWRVRRDGFSKFWQDTSGFGNPSNAEARRLKEYAQQFYDFYEKIAGYCRQPGVVVPEPSDEFKPTPAPSDTTPGWLKWTVAGVGVLGAVVIVRTLWGRV